jgi:hypothetical protein
LPRADGVRVGVSTAGKDLSTRNPHFGKVERRART